MKALAAAILAGLMAAAAVAPAQSLVPGASERDETGVLRSTSGPAIMYNIRLLPVASFPNLPAQAAAQLQSRGCMIPQTFEAQQPENVIEGAFHAPGAQDWAALCSVSGVTTLYVFFAGRYSTPSMVRSQPDTAWLGHEPGSSVYGSAWGIGTRTLADLRQSANVQASFPLDHDGIEDSHLEHSIQVQYFHQGQWVVLLSNDLN